MNSQKRIRNAGIFVCAVYVGGIAVGASPLLVIAALVYVLPTIVAVVRGHHNTAAIATLNILLGWTLVGWVGAIVWAMTAVREDLIFDKRRW